MSAVEFVNLVLVGLGFAAGIVGCLAFMVGKLDHAAALFSAGCFAFLAAQV